MPIACITTVQHCYLERAPSAQVVDALADGGVKTIALRNAGFDRVDVDAAKSRGMRVLRVPTYSPNSVAEHAVALLMAINRYVGW